MPPGGKVNKRGSLRDLIQIQRSLFLIFEIVLEPECFVPFSTGKESTRCLLSSKIPRKITAVSAYSVFLMARGKLSSRQSSRKASIIPSD